MNRTIPLLSTVEWPARPYPHQITGAARIRQDRRVYLAHDPGMGKTMTASFGATQLEEYYGWPIVCIAPVAAVPIWHRTLSRTGARNFSVSTWSRQPAPPSGEFILIADEAHLFAHDTSRRTIDFLRLADSSNCASTVLLSGTPMPNGKMMGLWPALKALRVQDSKLVFEALFKDEEAHNLMRLMTKDSIHIARKSEIDLPPMSIRTVRINQSPDYASLFNRSRSAYMGAFRFTNANALAMLSHLRQASSLAKVDAVVDDVYPGSQQHVILTSFISTRNAIAERLPDAIILKGGSTPKQVAEAERRFQDGYAQYLVSTIPAGGIALTLTAAHSLHLVDREYQWAQNVQAMCRVHRITQSNPVTITQWSASNTDDRVDELLAEKGTAVDAVFGLPIAEEGNAPFAVRVLKELFS